MSASTTTSAAAAASTTGSSGGGGSGPTSSPLLFFVALGFGVVFTNLWIIVGVKYCFRYNQRNRQRAIDEDGNPIDLMAMPRPHRRRKEKKLMSMEDVNERFPLTKYKAWRFSREADGLPTAGGVSVPPSRAPSIHHAEPGAASSTKQPTQTVEKLPLERTETVVSSIPDLDRENDQSDDEDDPIRTAAAPEMQAPPGDTCAICLDNLEDDDDVRGLTCGHAFHAACLDPWLTSRRACCPLCKADYYVPKPRAEGEDDTGRRERGLRMPQSPASAWISGGRRNNSSRPRLMLAGPRFLLVEPHTDQHGFPAVVHRGPGGGVRGRQEGEESRTWMSGLPRFPNLFRRGNTNTATANQSSDPTTTANTATTPGQLEAGISR